MSCACVLPCRMIQAAENEVAEMAREAARADAMARAARKAEMGEGQQLELQRLKVGSKVLGQRWQQLACGTWGLQGGGGRGAAAGAAQNASPAPPPAGPKASPCNSFPTDNCFPCYASHRLRTRPCSSCWCNLRRIGRRRRPSCARWVLVFWSGSLFKAWLHAALGAAHHQGRQRAGRQCCISLPARS